MRKSYLRQDFALHAKKISICNSEGLKDVKASFMQKIWKPFEILLRDGDCEIVKLWA
jgi:hypothetical protein